MSSMKDYLCIIITDGVHEWQQQGIAVPREGDYCKCRDIKSRISFEGKVNHVHWEIREKSPGMIVTVWLEKK